MSLISQNSTNHAIRSITTYMFHPLFHQTSMEIQLFHNFLAMSQLFPRIPLYLHTILSKGLNYPSTWLGVIFDMNSANLRHPAKDDKFLAGERR